MTLDKEIDRLVHKFFDETALCYEKPTNIMISFLSDSITTYIEEHILDLVELDEEKVALLIDKEFLITKTTEDVAKESGSWFCLMGSYFKLANFKLAKALTQ